MQFPPLRQPAHDTASRSQGAGGEATLPVWDLSDLYAGMEDPQLEADLKQAETDAAAHLLPAAAHALTVSIVPAAHIADAALRGIFHYCTQPDVTCTPQE